MSHWPVVASNTINNCTVEISLEILGLDFVWGKLPRLRANLMVHYDIIHWNDAQCCGTVPDSDLLILIVKREQKSKMGKMIWKVQSLIRVAQMWANSYSFGPHRCSDRYYKAWRQSVKFLLQKLMCYFAKSFCRLPLSAQVIAMFFYLSQFQYLTLSLKHLSCTLTLLDINIWNIFQTVSALACMFDSLGVISTAVALATHQVSYLIGWSDIWSAIFWVLYNPVLRRDRKCWTEPHDSLVSPFSLDYILGSWSHKCSNGNKCILQPFASIL